MIRSRLENRVRIIGGTWRSRYINFPPRKDLRPTSDRIRETLFNWLGQNLSGKSCLDLFAGSGVLGFEAASRGASKVIMVERDSIAYAALQQTSQTLGGASVHLIKQDAFLFLKKTSGIYDFVFLDPPFADNCLPQLLENLVEHTHNTSLVYFESGDKFSPASDWEFFRNDRAGKVHYGLLTRSKK